MAKDLEMFDKNDIEDNKSDKKNVNQPSKPTNSKYEARLKLELLMEQKRLDQLLDDYD